VPKEADTSSEIVPKIPREVRVKVTAWDSEEGKNVPTWIRAWMEDESRGEALEQIQIHYNAYCSEMGDAAFTVRDVLMSRAQATVLADFFLTEAHMCTGGASSRRGVEMTRLAIHLREAAGKHAERAISISRSLLEMARERNAGKRANESRAVFSAEGE
jgi:hypothetical protein